VEKSTLNLTYFVFDFQLDSGIPLLKIVMDRLLSEPAFLLLGFRFVNHLNNDTVGSLASPHAHNNHINFLRNIPKRVRLAMLAGAKAPDGAVVKISPDIGA